LAKKVKGWVFKKAASVCVRDQQRFDGVPQLVLAALLSEEGLPLLRLES
jgi:hypothetical protein